MVWLYLQVVEYLFCGSLPIHSKNIWPTAIVYFFVYFSSHCCESEHGVVQSDIVHVVFPPLSELKAFDCVVTPEIKDVSRKRRAAP